MANMDKRRVCWNEARAFSHDTFLWRTAESLFSVIFDQNLEAGRILLATFDLTDATFSSYPLSSRLLGFWSHVGL